jgi:hypothetical protein
LESLTIILRGSPFSHLPLGQSLQTPQTHQTRSSQRRSRRNARDGHLRKILYCAFLNGGECDCACLTASLNKIRIGCSSRFHAFLIMPNNSHHVQKAVEGLEVKHYGTAYVRRSLLSLLRLFSTMSAILFGYLNTST